jgi:hypothetical protein
MSAGKYNFEIEQGATFRRSVTYKDSDDVAIDLSNATVRMQIRNNYSSEEAAISLSTPDSGIALESDTGVFTFTITAEQTAALTFVQGVYDIEIEYASGDVERILEGRVKVSTEVTR